LICVIDTETTGLPNAAWARVVEIGAVALDPITYEERSAFDSLLCPDILDYRAERALDYTGISFDAVRAAPSLDEVRSQFLAWVSENAISEVWAYNRVFDETFLNRSDFLLPWQGCIMRLCRHHMPLRAKDPPLRESCAYFLGHEPERKHRALDDARTAAAVLRVLRRS